MTHKQVIIMRSDLKLPKGKAAAQAAHASVEAVLRSDEDKVRIWRKTGSAKIVLKVTDKQALYRYLQLSKDLGLKTALITDAGKTVIAPGTETCMAIGPDDEQEIDKVTGELKLF